MDTLSQRVEKNLVFDSNGTYTRTCSVERDKLENKLKELYGSQWCEIACSGINAIYITLFSLFESTNKKYILVADELFGFTKSTLSMLLKIFQIEQLTFDYNNPEQILELIDSHKNDIVCAYFESCSNPNNLSIDWTSSVLNQIHDSGIITVVDNTWLSPAKFNPFDYNISSVIDSCTKYLSGGSCIAGCINFKEYDEITKRISRNISLMGIHVSPVHCEIVLKNLDTLKARTENATKRTVEIVNFLKKINAVKCIRYNEIMKPCVIRFAVKTKLKIAECLEILESTCKTHLIEYSTSFGKCCDSIDTYPKVFESMLHLRLGVGYLHDDTFCERLKSFIDELSTKL